MNATGTLNRSPLYLSPLLIVFVACYCCFHPFTLLTSAQSNELLTSAPSTDHPTTITTLNEQYPITSTSSSNSAKPTTRGALSVPSTTTPPPPAITPKATTTIATSTSTATTITTTGAPMTNLSNIQQPKSLKFTLIAGKFWKFNIKSNSLPGKEGELRLHRNLSLHNYIIDDEGWFQYNPQEQQLFAWPNINVKPGTYLFVLLPSGIDFEADNENDVASPRVAANIVVELIRPLYIGAKADIDVMIDHKFSLDYLHRLQLYPLLLQQIVAVFNTIAQTNDTSAHQVHSDPSSLASLLTQQKNAKAAKRLGEYLLINSTYSSDGEYFSLTWSTHPSLVNNTISQLNECRTSAIMDVVTRLSSLSTGYQRKKDEYVVYYTLDAPIVNSQAIVPTDHGPWTRALKVTLNGPCQIEKIVEQLGIVFETSKEDTTSVVDGDDKENNLAKPPQTSKDLPISMAASTSLASSPPSTTSLPASESIDFGNASKFTTLGSINATSAASAPGIAVSLAEEASTNSRALQNHLMLNATIENATVINATEPPLTSTTAAITTQANRIDTEAQVFKSQVIPVLQEQRKMQPQAKSLANFLESSDVLQQTNNTTMTSVALAPKSSSETIDNQPTPPTVTAISASTNSLVTIAPSTSVDVNITSETSLNEDLIGILDDIVNYLTSVAIPIAIIVGIILLISIFIALCSLYMKRRKSKHFQVRNRFDFKYGSERRGFLKTSSKPVIMDADHKSLSNNNSPRNYFPLSTIQSDGPIADDATCGTGAVDPNCDDYRDSGGVADS